MKDACDFQHQTPPLSEKFQSTVNIFSTQVHLPVNPGLSTAECHLSGRHSPGRHSPGRHLSEHIGYPTVGSAE